MWLLKAASWLAVVVVIIGTAQAEEKTIFFDDGVLKARYEHTSGGVMHGRYEVYHPNGKPKTVGQYTNGGRTGRWVWLNELGDTTGVVEFNEKGEATNVPFVPSTSGCTPACRAGFRCVNGTCVTMCNPSCPDGTYCSDDGTRCVSYTREDARPPYGQRTRGPCSGNAECAPGYVCFDGDCEDIPEIASAGNAAMLISSIFAVVFGGVGGAATIYVAAEGYGTGSNHHSKGYGGGAGLVGWLAGCFGSSVTGALNRIPLAKQAQYLRTLGWKPENSWRRLSWGAYALSVSSYVVTAASFSADNQEFSVSMSVATAVLLATSLTTNVVAFAKQRQCLREMFDPAARDYGQGPRLEVVPYVAMRRDCPEAGLTFSLRAPSGALR